MKKLLLLLALLLPSLIKAETICVDGLYYEIVSDSESDTNTAYARLVAPETGKYSGDIVIPEKISYNDLEYPVSAVSDNSFAWGSNLISVKFLSKFTSLPHQCFYDIRTLTSVKLPSELTTLPDSCFNFCTSLKEIELPASLTSIGYGCFDNCWSLDRISVPAEVTSIGAWSISRTGIKYIDFEESEKILSVGYVALEGIPTIKFQRPVQFYNSNYSMGLRSLILGNKASAILGISLSNESKLKQIISQSSIPPSIEKLSPSQYDNVKLYIPSEAINNYLDDENWAFFKNVIPLDRNIDEYQLSISTDSIVLNVGEKYKLFYEISPQIDTDVFVYTTSFDSDDNFIEIDGNTVYAKKPGTGQITVISGLNGQIKTCNVSVIQPVTSIVLNKSSMTLNHGKTGRLFVNLSPVDASDQSIIWSSSDSSVATVEDGVVYAEGVGECLIFATAHNGMTASCAVTVLPTLVENLIIEPDPVIGNVGDEVQLNLTIIPEVVTDNTVTWSSDNTEIASVDENGLLSLNGIGECTVTVMANDESNISRTCSVQVLPILVDSIALNPNLIKPVKDLEVQIEATVLPENATEKILAWESDNPDVATVNENGLVKILETGECKIIARATDGSEVEAICVISDLEGIESIFADNIEWDVYTPNGILINKCLNATSLKNLPKGIYILRSGIRTVIIKI